MTGKFVKLRTLTFIDLQNCVAGTFRQNTASTGSTWSRSQKLFSHKISDFIGKDTCSLVSDNIFLSTFRSYVNSGMFPCAACRKVTKIYCPMKIDKISTNKGRHKWVNCFPIETVHRGNCSICLQFPRLVRNLPSSECKHLPLNPFIQKLSIKLNCSSLPAFMLTQHTGVLFGYAQDHLFLIFINSACI